jgi:hypothetical protein
MPLTGDFAGLARLRRNIEGLASPTGPGQRTLLAAVRSEVKQLLRTEFATSTGPNGPWVPTVRGKPALASKKLAQAFESEVVAGGVRFRGVVNRDWLEAHQEGHTFKSRSVAAAKQFLTFNSKGRLIKAKRALNKKGDVKRGVHQTFARAHTVGERVLPQRLIAPQGGILTPSWQAAIARGITNGMQRWYANTTR